MDGPDASEAAGDEGKVDPVPLPWDSMSVKELKEAVRLAGIESKTLGFTDKSEYVQLLINHHNPTPKHNFAADSRDSSRAPTEIEEILVDNPEVMDQAGSLSGAKDRKVSDIDWWVANVSWFKFFGNNLL